MKSFPEVPLHFLYGIWGSAFTILFKRLVQEKGRNSEVEILRLILGKGAAAIAGGKDMGADEEEELIVR